MPRKPRSSQVLLACLTRASSRKTQQRGSEAGRTQRTYLEGRRARSLPFWPGHASSQAHLGSQAACRSVTPERGEGNADLPVGRLGCTDSAFEMSSLASADTSKEPGTTGRLSKPKGGARRRGHSQTDPCMGSAHPGPGVSPEWLLPVSAVTVGDSLGKGRHVGAWEGSRCIFIFSMFPPQLYSGASDNVQASDLLARVVVFIRVHCILRALSLEFHDNSTYTKCYLSSFPFQPLRRSFKVGTVFGFKKEKVSRLQCPRCGICTKILAGWAEPLGHHGEHQFP